MNLPYHCILADQYRAFPERAEKWRRVKVSEPSRKRLAGNIVLRRFALPSPCIEGRGRRLAFISDLHFHGTAVEEQRVASLVGALTEAAPDVIFTGGDVIGDASDLRAIPGVLRRLASCARVAVAAPGNWERGKRWLSLDFWRELYTDGGFVFLCNEYRDLGVCGVYGGDDLVHGDPMPPPKLPSDGKLRILLVHRPDSVMACDFGARLDAFTLAFCGHTHGGQWRLPGAGAFYIPGLYRRRFDCGWFGKRDASIRMFVSTGAGELSLPGRFNCPREAVLIDLV